MPETNIPPPSPKSLPWLKIAGGLALVLIVALAVYQSKKQSKQTQVKENKQAPVAQGTVTPPPKLDVHPVDPAKSPSNFPASIPIEAGAKIIQNYNVTSSDGRIQATREFISSKTTAENFKIYSDYFKSAGWKITSTLDQQNLKMIAATKDKLSVLVNISQNPATNVVTVTISVVTSK